MLSSSGSSNPRLPDPEDKDIMILRNVGKLHTQQHSVTNQMNRILNNTAVTASNLAIPKSFLFFTV
jgi:hypothetical protein